ncbi:hypothetical protein [Labrys miyagiensis]|uniref:hypothetical protein n=1 Tax=Labrys miyagiensis TaxID=346912 RepID=UPI0024E175EC|nr:hypothetical protein [Labrys miyagiensis]
MTENKVLLEKIALVIGGSRGVGAGFVSCLAGLEAGFITDASLNIDGGYTLWRGAGGVPGTAGVPPAS